VAVLSRQHTVCGFTVHCKKTGIWLFVPYTAIACFVAFTGIRYATTMQKLHRTISRSSINKPEDVLPVFRDMEPVLKSTPVFTNSYAVFLFYNQDYERAVDKFNETLSYQASYTTCLELGRCYDRLGETDCALAYWELCSRMIPNRFEPMYLQIEACHRTGRHSRADSLTTLILQKKRKVDTIRIDRMIRDVKEWRKQREVNDEQ